MHWKKTYFSALVNGPQIPVARPRQTIEYDHEYRVSGVISIISSVFLHHRAILPETQKSSGVNIKSNNLNSCQELLLSMISTKTVMF